MAALESSPTKLITEGFQKMHLRSADDIDQQPKALRSNSETLTSAKNHLHIPKLIFNQDFTNESKVGDMTEDLKDVVDVGADGYGGEYLGSDDTVGGKNGDEVNDGLGAGADDTVIHNEDRGNDTIPEWLAVKMKMEQKTAKESRIKPKLINQDNVFASDHIRPKLANSLGSSKDDTNDPFNESNLNNATWDEIKRQYDLSSYDNGINDISGIIDKSSDNDSDSEEELENYNNDTSSNLRPQKNLNDTSVFSFQDLNNLRVISDAQSSSNGTRKVTSFKSNFIDSPMAAPKIVKSIKPQKKAQISSKSVNGEGELEDIFGKYDIHDNVEIQLITPVDQNMKFDTDSGKWIYPNESKKINIKYDDILHIDDEEDEKHQKGDNNQKHTQKEMAKNSSKNTKLAINSLKNTFQPDESIRNSTSLTFDAQQVTSITHLDISFSESQKNLIKALTSSIKPATNWDKVEKVNLSRSNLISAKCLNEFVPNLVSVELDYNNISTIEGLSSDLEDVSVSHNKISNNFLNFQKFQFLHKLDISFNRLQNMNVFQNLRNLRDLNLSNNEIEEFVELRTLQHLNLSHNKIKGSLDFTNHNLPALESLNLSNNEISKVIITNLPKLRTLRLDNNGTFLRSLDLKEPIQNLKKLSILQNPDLKRVVSFQKMSNLRSLSFDGSTTITGDFPKLEVLRVENDAKLEKTLSNSLRLNKHLLSLSVKNCSIDADFLFTLKLVNNFPHLQRINLANNEIKMTNMNLVVFFKKFKNLTKIKLDGNPIVDDIKDEEDKRLFKLMMRKLLSEF